MENRHFFSGQIIQAFSIAMFGYIKVLEGRHNGGPLHPGSDTTQFKGYTAGNKRQ
jgi:hypothetical protein